MLLMLEIAGGIILAVLFFAFLHWILIAAYYAMIGLVLVAALAGAYLTWPYSLWIIPIAAGARLYYLSRHEPSQRDAKNGTARPPMPLQCPSRPLQ
jgi:hypothetical protein